MYSNKKKNIRGATMVEYVLLIGLIAAAAIVALTSVGTNISSFFTNLSTTISTASANV